MKPKQKEMLRRRLKKANKWRLRKVHRLSEHLQPLYAPGIALHRRQRALLWGWDCSCSRSQPSRP
jgi:hypothetical protein